MQYNHKQRWCWIGHGYNFEPAPATPDGFWNEITEHCQCRVTVQSASLTSSCGATFVPVWEASCQWVRRCTVVVPRDSVRSNALAVTWKRHSVTLSHSQCPLTCGSVSLSVTERCLFIPKTVLYFCPIRSPLCLQNAACRIKLQRMPEKHNDITISKKCATENANTISRDTYETV